METSYEVVFDGTGVPIKAWTRGVEFEEEARRQLARMAALPFAFRWIAAMPDVHSGKGATVGSVIATLGAIVPAAVGVDIGCGMLAVRTDLHAEDLPDSLAPLRAAIEAAVPHGRTDEGGRNDRGAWRDPPEAHREAWGRLSSRYAAIVAKAPRLGRGPELGHLGTLGGGNHFIELSLDQEGMVWVVLHSGSRGVGNRIGTHFIALARQEMERWFIALPDQDLAYLPEGSRHYGDYLEAVGWAQDFAAENRRLMMERVLGAMAASGQLPRFTAEASVVNCHHNYVAKERHYGAEVLVTRKGAVRAGTGELGIIPGSMGARTYIVRGKGNPESFESCSHGAGRRMSRTKARQVFTPADHAAATRGVECRKDPGVLDETPGAYKDIDAVMKAQEDLVEVVHVLSQVVCVKG